MTHFSEHSPDPVKVSPQQAITKTATAVLCDGGRYIDGTDTLYRPGDYVLRRKTSAGCDSLIALSLSAVQAQDFAARPDTGYLLPNERSAEFDILANDLFPDEKSLVLIEPVPAHGDAKLTKLEQLVYTVYDDDFFGYDTVYYQLCPPQDCPEACDTGMLVLFVQSGKVEDAKKIMPNAFTPNGDGKNDVFAPLQTLEQNGLPVPYERAELTILNRFGEIVFFKRPYETWDGKLNGEPVPQATYYYLLRFGDAPPLKGPVTRM